MSEENKNTVDIISEENKVEEVNKEVKKETKKEVKNVVPKLFFKQDSRIKIVINGYHDKETGELKFVGLAENDNEDKDNLENLFMKVPYTFEFTRCTYDKLNFYRSRSMIYNTEDQNNTINELRLREYFLVYHLVDWDLKDEEGNKIILTRDPNDTLSDESLNLIYTLPANMVDVLLTAYERKMSI